MGCSQSTNAVTPGSSGAPTDHKPNAVAPDQGDGSGMYLRISHITLKLISAVFCCKLYCPTNRYGLFPMDTTNISLSFLLSGVDHGAGLSLYF